jgi:hypothetical protein
MCRGNAQESIRLGRQQTSDNLYHSCCHDLTIHPAVMRAMCSSGGYDGRGVHSKCPAATTGTVTVVLLHAKNRERHVEDLHAYIRRAFSYAICGSVHNHRLIHDLLRLCCTPLPCLCCLLQFM